MQVQKSMKIIQSIETQCKVITWVQLGILIHKCIFFILVLDLKNRIFL